MRAMIETMQRETGGTALARLRRSLSPHLLELMAHKVLAAPSADAQLELSAGMELLLACDRVLCGGSGAVTTRAMNALASRVLAASSGLVVPGDVVRTLQHLRAPFEQPFTEVDLQYSARRTPEGFVLTLSFGGEPQATRWLGWAGLGYAQAAATFSGQAEPFRINAEFEAQGARVVGRNARASLPASNASSTHPPAPRRPSSSQRPAVTQNLAERVEHILTRSITPPGPAAAITTRPLNTPPTLNDSPPVDDTRPTPLLPPGGRGSGVRAAEGAAVTRKRKSNG